MSAGPGSLSIVVLGLSITSAWGNGHATTYRALVRALARRGHEVLFLERDMPWYAAHRDLPRPPYGRTLLYQTVEELQTTFARAVRQADLVVVGSFVPDGVAVGEWVIETARGATAFYDIDTPVTLAKLARGDEAYLSADLIPRYDVYFSFTGGPILKRLERDYGARGARALYCAVDPELYRPEVVPPRYDLGYVGTYSDDRQPKLDALLLDPARACPGLRFAVAGPQYPRELVWPDNVERIEYLEPGAHQGFYGAQRFTLNLTRADMVAAGWSPSVRLFEAAACGTPIISDWWPGLERFFRPGEEILIAHATEDVLRCLEQVSEAERRTLGAAARRKVLARHTAAHRARQIEAAVAELSERRAARSARARVSLGA